MTPRFDALKKYHYRTHKGQSNYLDGADLYRSLARCKLTRINMLKAINLLMVD